MTTSPLSDVPPESDAETEGALVAVASAPAPAARRPTPTASVFAAASEVTIDSTMIEPDSCGEPLTVVETVGLVVACVLTIETPNPSAMPSERPTAFEDAFTFEVAVNVDPAGPLATAPIWVVVEPPAVAVGFAVATAATRLTAIDVSSATACS